MPSPQKTRAARGAKKEAEETKALKGGSKNNDDSDDDEVAQSQQVQAKFVPRGGQGFQIKFEMPFRAKDVFRELSRPDDPLGLDKEFSAVTIVRPGVSRDKVFSVGFVRKSTFKNKLLGQTSSELMELEDGKKYKAMTWRVLNADMPFAIRGKKRAPECIIECEDVFSGSVMAITYDYEFGTVTSPCCCLGGTLPWLLKTLVTRALARPDNLFIDQMVERGYKDVNISSAARLQAVCKAFAVRRAEARQRAKKMNNRNEDDDDDDDDGKKKKSRPQRHGAVGGPGAFKADLKSPTKPKESARAVVKEGGVATAPSRPQRQPPAADPGSRPTRPNRAPPNGTAATTGAGVVAGAGGTAAVAIDSGSSTVMIDDDEGDHFSTMKVIDDDDE